MFYKHWKKIALALTGYFWAGCENDTTSANEAEDPSSSSIVTPKSSSSVKRTPASSSSEASCKKKNSSSSTATDKKGKSSSSAANDKKQGSSSSEATNPESSSNEFEMIMPLYGIEMSKTICTQVKGDSTINCGDGVTCTEKIATQMMAPPCSVEKNEKGEFTTICPDYGIVRISDSTYECDGKVYSEAEFKARYMTTIIEGNPQDPPKEDTIKVEPITDTLFFKDSSFMQPALYGPPCVFNGTCGDKEE